MSSKRPRKEPSRRPQACRRPTQSNDPHLAPATQDHLPAPVSPPRASDAHGSPHGETPIVENPYGTLAGLTTTPA